ncbi:MAG TPA: carboxypeptidase regulatory-like domain-containing protein [Kiritimatiellia bacterium]|jgi:5-hydroxyisourate hydrolase-like protein (transthyretin family)|nr:MAG: Cna protein B-type domain protein [Verrucomicrobia bacterium ADurb.Bin018]HOD99835.1 carboxypeptidase regulatory-like domain-containing protein [Kiritimatiellia bacterium]HOE37247.1 carboxypeptidase regulatory-like domain-containing protein [Kiritimatiellia bacterium]HOR74184.1 carboxypeptidase regulatory-like domain-containing protein [Kiritimatiellia bacterium]HOU58727.1 carboxypeptidase regulatory-like domain-containing protein [Kiritimatiellia bacterium]
MRRQTKWVLGVVLFTFIVPLLLCAAPPGMLNSGNAEISGKVTDLKGTPLKDITVEVRQQSGQAWPVVKTNNTDAAGLYTVAGLGDGSYIVAFDDPAGVYAREIYENTFLVYNAHTVTVTAASPATDINASLALAGKISGTFTNSAGSPLQFAYLVSFRKNGVGWQPMESTLSDAAGNYALAGLPAGIYRIFYTYEGQEGYYDNAPDLLTATDISIAAGQAVSNINFTVGERSNVGAISGNVTEEDGVTPLDHIYVTIFRWADIWWQRYTEGVTDAEGKYLIENLPPGKYRVYFEASHYGEGKYYDNAPDIFSATDITVSAGETTTNINAAMSPGAATVRGESGAIAGTVTQQDGTTPIAQVHVTAFRWVDVWWQRYAEGITDTEGNYSITNLPPGTYRIQFEAWHGGFGEFYDNVPDIFHATDITVEEGQTTANINAALAGQGCPDYETWSASIDWQGAPNGPADDADGDGFSNDLERIAGTNPVAANDFFTVSSAQLTPAGNGLILGTALFGRAYTARYSTDIRLPWREWTPIELSFSDGLIIAPVIPNQPNVIYRLIVDLE